MSELTIAVRDGAHIVVRVDGEPVGLIKDLCLVGGKDAHPSVAITLVSANEYWFDPDDPERDKLLERLHRYEKLLLRCPCVELLSRADTLPSSQAADTIVPSSPPSWADQEER